MNLKNIELPLTFTLNCKADFTIHTVSFFSNGNTPPYPIDAEEQGEIVISDTIDTHKTNYAIWGDENEDEWYICIPHYEEDRSSHDNEFDIVYLHDLFE